MRIIVPIKQVPETGNVKMDEETGTIIREGSERIINPLDLYALEKAIQLKEEQGGTVTAISMGPPAAAEALREAVAMGCDEATLITDRAFAGSDTWATSIILSEAIRHLGEYDLIIAGERATDGDTGQVGPNLAAALELPLATFIRSLEILPRESDNERNSEGGTEAAGEASGKPAGIRVERLIEEGYEVLELPLPALVTVVKEITYPRLPTLRGKQRARTLEIPQVNAAALNVDEAKIGLKGSPTRVVKITKPKVTRTGRLEGVKDETSLNNAVTSLIRFLQEKGFLSDHGKERAPGKKTPEEMKGREA
jgi:electron transfer flavoprotein beta subunit